MTDGRSRVGPFRLLKPSEVAALFGVDPRTVGRWARSGKLRYVRTIGGHFRFDPDEIDAVLKASTADDVTEAS
jgi:excisionase family DNA binding protein